MRILVLLALVGCDPVSIQLTGSDTAGGDADTDTDADSDSDSDADADTDPTYVTDFSFFDGSRQFNINTNGFECDDVGTESGPEIVDGDDMFESVADLCGDCSHFYEVNPDETYHCENYIQLGTTYRGLEVDEASGEAIVRLFREGDRGLEEYATDEGGTITDGVVDFFYQYEPYRDYVYDIVGVMGFERLLQE